MNENEHIESAQPYKSRPQPYPGFSLLADIVCVCMAMLVLVVANRLNESGKIFGAFEHVLNFLAILLFIAPAMFMAFRSESGGFIRSCMSAGSALLLVHELVQIFNNIWPDALGEWFLGLRPVMLGVGFCMFMVSMYLALINMARTHATLFQERNRLAEEVAERKRAENERAVLEGRLWQTQKSESLDRMAGAIAHHFNNQLHTVIGNLELAAGRVSGDPECADLLEEAMQASRRASAVSNLMLTYVGQTLGKREPTDLSELCSRNLPMLQSVLPKNAELQTALAPGHLMVKANSGQMQQVLLNLVTNAGEALEGASGNVRITTRVAPGAGIPVAHCFPIGASPNSEDYACLEVFDTGAGIPPDRMDSLFDPFYSTRFTGRGMGLAVVLGIVRAHGGVVTVASESDRGSVFSVFLPLSTAQSPQPRAATSTLPPKPVKGAFLLVDDEEAVRKIGSLMLGHLGFDVITAQDGAEAVEIVRKSPDDFCCVLCDLTMPRMDGWSTLAALREIAPALPVILATGYGADRLVPRKGEIAPEVCLGKPFLLEELEKAIQRAMA